MKSSPREVQQAHQNYKKVSEHLIREGYAPDQESADDIIKGMTMIAEGVETSKAIYKLSNKINIEMPICNEVYNILFKNKDPKSAINDLMSRKLIDE